MVSNIRKVVAMDGAVAQVVVAVIGAAGPIIVELIRQRKDRTKQKKASDDI
jgi:hypothetical protein